MDFTGRIAVVTGSSRGLGRAIALKLARLGAGIVVNYQKNVAAAEEVAAEIKANGGRALTVQADVARAEDAERLIRQAVEAYGRLDILVNNAGTTRDTLLMRMTEEDWDLVLDCDLKSAYLCTKAAMRPMMKQRYGRIVNIASVAGLAGNAGQANYSAAKAGLIGFTKAVAREVGSRNITVNAVAPGLVPTDLTSSLPEEVKAAMLQQTPLGRFGTAEDVANAVAFLASDEASYITGQVLSVDGGMVMM